jgi:hypothetical protein
VTTAIVPDFSNPKLLIFSLMKKLLTFLTLTGLFILPSLAFADLAPEPDAFTDVQWGDEGYWEISALKEAGILEGYPDGSFEPDSSINRAEFAKIVAIAAWDFDPEGVEFTSWLDFYDIEQNAWYTDYLHKLYDEDIIDGYPDGSFKPDDNVNFVEAAKMIVAAYDKSTGKDGDYNTHGGEWFEPYVDALNEIDAVPESITSNDQEITRLEMAQMIYGVRYYSDY